jgi:3-oxoadipate enol-lactonase
MPESVLMAAPLGAPGSILTGLVPDTCAVIAYEHPGQLLSPALPAGASMSDFARRALDAAARADAHPVALVGFGFGGMVALQAALDAPGRVMRLVLVGTSAAPGNTHAWNERAAAVRAQGLAALAPAIVERWITPGLRSAQPELPPILRAALQTCTAEGYATACETIAAFDVTARLSQLEIPTLVVSGAQDAGLPSEHGRRLAASIPCGRYVQLPGAGHLPFLERFGELRSLIAEHLREPTHV